MLHLLLHLVAAASLLPWLPVRIPAAPVRLLPPHRRWPARCHLLHLSCRSPAAWPAAR
jgi:hypothetical protein